MAFLKTAFIGVFALAVAFAQAPQPQSSASMALTADQKAKLVEIKKNVEKKAAPIAEHFAAVTKQVYENMLSDAPDQELRLRLSHEMSTDASQILALKGESIWAAVGILTATQKAALKLEMAKPNAPADLTEIIDRQFNH